MKILLFSHLTQIPRYASYVKAFKEVIPVRTLLLTMGEKEYELGENIGEFDVVKDVLPKQSEIEGDDCELSGVSQKLRGLEERIGSRFVHKDILMDRYFRGQSVLDIDLNKVPLIWTGTRTEQFMYAIYNQLQKELEKFEPDFVYVETNSAPYRMAWRLAREKGIPAGIFMPVRFWPDRIYLETGIGLDWAKARQHYSKSNESTLKGIELSEINDKLETILQEKTKPPYMKWDYAKGSSGIIKRLAPKNLLKGFGDWLGPRAQSYTMNPRVLPGNLYSPLAKFVRYRNSVKAKRFLRKHVTQLDQIQEKMYAIYFLHVQPEITVEEMAFEYQDQVNTLRNILAYLPADMSLVVKEHTPMLGHRPQEVYRRLLHMPGIIIADSHEDSHELIVKASVVITLTGTVALEAMLYGIPAIVLGSIFFDCYKGIYKPENLQELEKLLSNPTMLLGASREDAIRALGSMFMASVPGILPRTSSKLEDIDIESAKSMVSELREAVLG